MSAFHHLFSRSRYLTLLINSPNHPIGPIATRRLLQILPALLFLCDFLRSDAPQAEFPNLFAPFVNAQDLLNNEAFPILQAIKYHLKMMILASSLKAQIRSESVPPPIPQLPRVVKAHLPLLVAREIWATPTTGPVQPGPDIPRLRMRRRRLPCRALSFEKFADAGLDTAP